MTTKQDTTKLAIKYKPIGDLIPYARNSRTHSEAQVAQIAASIKEFGWTNPVLLDGENGIIAGHGRVMAAQKLGEKQVPTIELSHLDEHQKRAYIIADNKLALNAGWDDEILALEIDDLKDAGYDLELLGFSDAELEALANGANTDEINEPKGNLADKFLISPFSILNAREGWWQARKKAWLSLGIKSEEGRDNNLLSSLNKLAKNSDQGAQSDNSIFDPVLCELTYLWFSMPNAIIVDPFAGGSVRGIVASKLKRQYIGHELRQEQVDANREQGSVICVNDEMPPAWICGDSRNITNTCKDVQADLIFSCPPYADLEVYSDDPKDLSTLGYEEFKNAYFEIIKKSCALLKQDRFAVFVVGEVRDKKGNYYDFVGDTVQAFKEAGLNYYNEAILITMIGAKAMTVSAGMKVSRKLGKTHQNVLVFVKGDGKKAAKACGDIYIDDSLLEMVADG
jgi:ParB-like chromosome segregation protein Spo0J